mmetsp:Transcript_28967/g.75854  ORF Transcript_28967/g.75854 Transcript_28967/m.75854 type:complete len:200 (+) Transcript_28967:160-759(+)
MLQRSISCMNASAACSAASAAGPGAAAPYTSRRSAPEPATARRKSVSRARRPASGPFNATVSSCWTLSNWRINSRKSSSPTSAASEELEGSGKHFGNICRITNACRVGSLKKLSQVILGSTMNSSTSHSSHILPSAGASSRASRRSSTTPQRARCRPSCCMYCVATSQLSSQSTSRATSPGLLHKCGSTRSKQLATSCR